MIPFRKLLAKALSGCDTGCFRRGSKENKSAKRLASKRIRRELKKDDKTD